MVNASSDIAVRVGAASSSGRVRSVNEDSFLAEFPLYVVADGMGGHAAGDRASALAVDALRRLAGRALSALDVQAALDLAGEQVRDLASPDGSGAGAGTTVSGAVLVEQGGAAYWLVVNLGDSRVYVLEDGLLRQVTVDHSVVQELLDSGDLDPNDAGRHPERHVVTRALGTPGPADPDFWLLPVTAGQRLLICSDGLTTELDHGKIEQLLQADPDPQGAVDALLEAALHAGGRDNVTVLVIDAFTSGPLGADHTRPRPTAVDAVDGVDERTRPRKDPTA